MVDKVIYIEKESRIRPFYGERVLEFEEDVRRAWKSLGDDNARKLDVITSNLSPAVKVELSCHDQTSQTDPEELLKLVISIYGESRSSLQLLNALLQQQQQTGEDVRSFSQRLKTQFDALVRRQEQLKEATQPETTLRDQFILGLKDVGLRRLLRQTLKTNKAASFQVIRAAALDYVLEGDDACLAAAAATQSVGVQPSQQGACSSVEETIPQLVQAITSMQTVMAGMMAKMDRLLDDRPVAPPRRDLREVRCYGCNEKGHYRRNCPKAKPQA